jgi:hypothetical protein
MARLPPTIRALRVNGRAPVGSIHARGADVTSVGRRRHARVVFMTRPPSPQPYVPAIQRQATRAGRQPRLPYIPTRPATTIRALGVNAEIDRLHGGPTRHRAADGTCTGRIYDGTTVTPTILTGGATAAQRGPAKKTATHKFRPHELHTPNQSTPRGGPRGSDASPADNNAYGSYL